MLNKYKYIESNTKKLLHKIGKHWAVVTVGALALCAFGAPIHSEVHASNTTNNQPQVQRTISQHKSSIKSNHINKDVSKPTIKIANTKPIVHKSVVQRRTPITYKTSSTKRPVARQPQVVYARHARRHAHRSYRGYHKYLLTDKDSNAPYITNHQINDLIHYRNTDEDGEFSLSINAGAEPISGREPWVKVTKHAKVGNYNFYRIYGKRGLNGDWVIADELGNHRYKSSLREWKSFAHAQSYRYMRHYLTKSQRASYWKIHKRYDYLLKHDENASAPIGRYRHDVFEWLKFYRNNVMHINTPVYLNSAYSQHAQHEISAGRDPEVASFGGSNSPEGVVDGLFTDNNNADTDGQTGHRNYILNPNDYYVGVGRAHGNAGMYFDWGIENGASYSNKTLIGWPRGLFSLNDAETGQYWSFQFYENPYDYQGFKLGAPNITVYDKTAKKYLHVSHVHTSADEIYWSVNPNRLHLYHTYRIHMYGNGDGDFTWHTTLVNF